MQGYCGRNSAGCSAGWMNITSPQSLPASGNQHVDPSRTGRIYRRLRHRAGPSGNEQVSTRRLRVVKYRGSSHGTDEYPYMIDEDGISVVPITSLALTHKAPTARVSTGVAGLDEIMEGKGFFHGSSVLVTGTAGTGKSSLAAKFAQCRLRPRRKMPVFHF